LLVVQETHHLLPLLKVSLVEKTLSHPNSLLAVAVEHLL
jgi:hypothetical protein